VVGGREYVLVDLINPDNVIKLHRSLLFKLKANCGKGITVTHRAELFLHGADKNQVQIGNHVSIDGTLEIYERGLLTIGDYCFVGRARIYTAHSVTIGEYCLISDNVCIMDSDLHPRSATKRGFIARNWADGRFPDVYSGVNYQPIILKPHVWVGYGSAILKGTTIGEGAIIGAGSVVASDVPSWTIVAGNPAKVIREIPPDER
jgi:acetyltransferase-like isoleucine patch superfamily enzyme